MKTVLPLDPMSMATTAAAPETGPEIARPGPSRLFSQRLPPRRGQSPDWRTRRAKPASADGAYPSVGGVVPAGRSPEEVVGAVGDRDAVAGRACSGRSDPAGSVQPLNPGRAGQTVAIGPGGRHDCLEKQPRNVPRPARHRDRPRGLNGAAVL
jgi:hypothetical protein